MMEVLSGVIDYGYNNAFPFRINRIEALMHVEHEASAELLRKLGFREEGVRRKYGHRLWRS